MKNLVFMLWLVLWPCVETLDEWVKFKINEQKPNDDNSTSGVGMVFMAAFYIFVAWLLYQK